MPSIPITAKSVFRPHTHNVAGKDNAPTWLDHALNSINRFIDYLARLSGTNGRKNGLKHLTDAQRADIGLPARGPDLTTRHQPPFAPRF